MLKAKTAVEVCLVGDDKQALIDAQQLQAGATEEYEGYELYRLDIGPGDVDLHRRRSDRGDLGDRERDLRGGLDRDPRDRPGRSGVPVSVRAGIVVTGTEVLTGRTSDRNGPWVSERLGELGIEVAHLTVVGDRPDDLLAALTFLEQRGMDLIVTTGGLGPTADDLTAEVVGRFAGREMRLDEEMEAEDHRGSSRASRGG